MLKHHSEINMEKWDNLVLSSGGTIFSTSAYLKAVANNWMVWVDENYTFGIALPFTEKLGVKTLYQPFFSRYQEVLGEKPSNFREILKEIKTYFVRSLVSFKSEIKDWNSSDNFVYQEVNPETKKLSSSVKRAINKFEKTAYSVVENKDVLILNGFITKVLAEKVAVFANDEKEYIKRLVENLNAENKINSIEIFENEKLVGGIMYMTFGERIIYLKGACTNEVTQLGGMYKLLQTLIIKTEQENKQFDFGGSRVEGVRTFNQRLGGEDVKYYAYHWDNSPFWFKLAQTARKWIKK